MAETKYGKYIIREPIDEKYVPPFLSKGRAIPQLPPHLHFAGEEHLDGANMMISVMCISEPFLMREDAHAHDIDKYMCFLGGNPMDIKDFGAEVELCLGEEEEKHIINSTTVVYVPKGLLHSPLNFKRVDKPIIFMDIMPASKRTPKQIYK